MPTITIPIRLATPVERQLRRFIHRRGDVLRLLSALIEEGLQDVSRFTPGRRRRTDPAVGVTQTSVNLDTALLARLDTAAQQLGTSRAALIEAMIAAKWPADPPAPRAGSRRLLSLSLDPLLEQQLRQQYIRAHGDLSKTVTDIVHAGLAALERFAAVPRRRPRGQQRLLTVTLETAVLARLTAAAKDLGTSRAALIEAMIAARLRGDM